MLGSELETRIGRGIGADGLFAAAIPQTLEIVVWAMFAVSLEDVLLEGVQIM